MSNNLFMLVNIEHRLYYGDERALLEDVLGKINIFRVLVDGEDLGECLVEIKSLKIHKTSEPIIRKVQNAYVKPLNKSYSIRLEEDCLLFPCYRLHEKLTSEKKGLLEKIEKAKEDIAKWETELEKLGI